MPGESFTVSGVTLSLEHAERIRSFPFTSEEQARIVDQDDPEVLAELARNPHLSTATQHLLFEHPLSQVFHPLLRNPTLGEGVALSAAQHPSHYITQYFAAFVVNAKARSLLMERGRTDERIIESLAENPSLLPGEVRDLSFSENVWVLQTLSDHSVTSPDASFSARFVHGYYLESVLESLLPAGTDMEAACALAPSWSGSVATLGEAVGIVCREHSFPVTQA